MKKSIFTPLILLFINSCYSLDGSESGIHYCKNEADCLSGYTCWDNICYFPCSNDRDCPNYRLKNDQCDPLNRVCPPIELCLDNGYCQYYQEGQRPEVSDNSTGNQTDSTDTGNTSNNSNNSNNNNHDNGSSFTCSDDNQCISGQWCTDGRCGTSPKKNGSHCRQAAYCSSGYCVDGVCCNCPCNQSPVCSQDQQIAYSCSSGICTTVTNSCGTYSCTDGSCLKSCFVHSDCAGKYYCKRGEYELTYNLPGTCGAEKPCENDDECQSDERCNHYALSSYYNKIGICTAK